MTIVKIFNNHSHYTLFKPAIEQVVSYIVNMEQQAVQSITFIASDDKTLNEMKVKLFGIDQLTDTISINYNEIDQPVEGEIYLSLDRIEDNAHTFKVSFEKELALVIIHSVLHLLGYNDDNLNDKKTNASSSEFLYPAN